MPVIASQGHEVEVFKFAMYDISTDEVQTSRRWATEAAITKFGATRLGAGVKVDPCLVDADGLTERGFDPNAGAGGFQREVRSTQRP